jgi:hypothetical protein
MTIGDNPIWAGDLVVGDWNYHGFYQADNFSKIN